MAGALVGGGKLTRGVPDPPRLQTVRELLDDGVDLDAHEHPTAGGHVLARHVDVDVAFLEDRLVNGTLQADGRRTSPPASVSAFTDRATAERAITETLRRNEGRIMRWAEGPPLREVLTMSATFDDVLGVEVRRGADGFQGRPGHDVFVVLRRRGDRVLIETAYLGKTRNGPVPW